MTAKSIVISIILLCSLSIAKPQNTPLFNDKLDPDEFKGKAIPRSFDADRLTIPDGEGGTKDLRQSPCYKEIGFNPSFSREEIVSMYEACEAEKRKNNIFTTLVIILCCGVAWVAIRKYLRSQQA